MRAVSHRSYSDCWTSYEKGLWSEFVCAVCLLLKGYRLVAWRFKTPLGELDFIALHHHAVVVVEVKRRQNPQACGHLISPKQLKRLCRGVAFFIKQHPRFRNFSLRGDMMIHKPWSWPQHLKNIF